MNIFKGVLFHFFSLCFWNLRIYVEGSLETKHIRISKAITYTKKDDIFQKYTPGSRFKYECKTDDTNAYLIWLHQIEIEQEYGNKNAFILSRVIKYDSNLLTLDITLLEYDNSTWWTCIAYNRNTHQQVSRSYNIKFILDYEEERSKKKIPYDKDMVKPRFKKVTKYKPDEFKNVTCCGAHSRWFKIIGGKTDWSFGSYINNEQNKCLDIQIKLRKTDSGAKFFCVAYKNEKNSYKRKFSEIFQFVIEDEGSESSSSNDTDNEDESLENNSNNNDIDETTDKSTDLALNDPKPGDTSIGTIVGLVAGGVLLLVLIFVLWKFFRNKNKPRNCHTEVETYAYPTTVQYATLQLENMKNEIKFSEDQSPYAEIVGVLMTKT